LQLTNYILNISYRKLQKDKKLSKACLALVNF